MTLSLHPQSILTCGPPRLIVFSEILRCQALQEEFIHNASGIEAPWIEEVAGHYFLDRSKEIISQNMKKDIKVRSQAEEDLALMESLATKKANVQSDF